MTATERVDGGRGSGFLMTTRTQGARCLKVAPTAPRLMVSVVRLEQRKVQTDGHGTAVDVRGHDKQRPGITEATMIYKCNQRHDEHELNGVVL